MTRYSKFAGVFVSAMLVAGAATAAPRLSPDLQKQATAMRLVTCLSKAAHRHDDGVSDPDKIAERIAPLCDSDFAREQTAFGASLSGNDQAQYRTIMDENRTSLAAEVVMHERTAQNRLARSN